MSELTSAARRTVIQFAIDDNATTNAGADSEQNQIIYTPPGAKAMFAQGSGTGIIEQESSNVVFIRQHISKGHIVPAGEVGG